MSADLSREGRWAHHAQPHRVTIARMAWQRMSVAALHRRHSMLVTAGLAPLLGSDGSDAARGMGPADVSAGGAELQDLVMSAATAASVRSADEPGCCRVAVLWREKLRSSVLALGTSREVGASARPVGELGGAKTPRPPLDGVAFGASLAG